MHAQSSKTCLPTASAALAFVAILLLTAFATLPAQAQTFKVLHTFTSSPDGAFPGSATLLNVNGNLYGTTISGGVNGFGTIFKIYSDGGEAVLYSFTGDYPSSGLTVDAAGNFYGTAGGGPGGHCGGYDCGTVFKVDASTGAQTVLHQFLGYPNDGAGPSDLVMDSLGNLYGTTGSGGPDDFGTVFKIDPSGTETVLHSFNGVDGAHPLGELAIDSSGNLYGTTFGALGTRSANGTVFKVDPSGTVTLLHRFTGGDGKQPESGVIIDDKGNLYGTAAHGGYGEGYGVVFRINPGGHFTVLYYFAGAADGLEPLAPLVRDGVGHLYGTTYLGGTFDYGTIYRIDGRNNKTILHNFDSSQDGSEPIGGLTMEKNGALLGTTSRGGANVGTVFELLP